MEGPIFFTAFMFVALAAALLAGYPVAFTLAGVALLSAGLGLALGALSGVDIGVLDVGYLGLFPERIFGIMTNEVLLAVPLFISMGVMLERSRVAEDLLDSMSRLFGKMRGGLGISVTIVGALMAASTGIVGATVVTMGLMALPTMLRRGYDPAFASGSIAAAGTLGQIIPPSIVLVLLADVLSSAWQEAQRDMGVWSPSPLSVGDLFAGALLPGVGLVLLYILYQLGVALFRPSACPAMPEQGANESDDHESPGPGQFLVALLPPFFLIIAVMGSILTGAATPTEAAAVGAIGAFLLGGLRLAKQGKRLIGAAVAALVLLLLMAGMGGIDPSTFGPKMAQAMRVGALFTAIAFLWGFGAALRATFAAGVLGDVLTSTVRISTMIFTILIGAALFSLVFRGFGGDEIIARGLGQLPGGVVGAVLVVMIVMFLLGFFLDFIEITFVVVPIVAPVLLSMGVNPVWLGIMMAVNLQTSFLTPPFGFALFYLRGVAPDTIRTTDIYRGVAPFVVIQLIALGLLAAFPGLATWLPDAIFGR